MIPVFGTEDYQEKIQRKHLILTKETKVLIGTISILDLLLQSMNKRLMKENPESYMVEFLIGYDLLKINSDM